MRSRSWAPALLALATGAAGAQAPAAPVLAWSAQAGAQHRRLVERADDGRRLVEESGAMLRLGIDATLLLAAGGAWQAAAGGATGNLDYDGQTQAGTPLATRTGHRDLDFTLAWRPLPSAAWGEGWLLLHTVQQRRQIASTPRARGLRETSTLLMPGVRWTHDLPAGSWRWRPRMELRTSAKHWLDVEFGGVFDPAELTGGRRSEAVLGLAVSSLRSPWDVGFDWTHTRQSASPQQALTRAGAPVGSVRQPRIEIDDLMLRVRRAF